MNPPAIFLVDNGSLRPEATHALREIADALSRRIGKHVEPVSLLHSHKIPAEQLQGVPATIVKRRMRELIGQGQREFLVVPFFLGPSLAIIDYLPEIIDGFRQECPDLSVKIAEPIAGADVENPDPRLAQILADHLSSHLKGDAMEKLALIDHGTPYQPVNTLRNAVADQLAELLGRSVQACSMERREGPEYAFNDPLLKNLAEVGGYAGSRLVLGMFFLLSGRHAGKNGDVSSIAEGLVQRGAFQSIQISSLLAEHPLLLDILVDRIKRSPVCR